MTIIHRICSCCGSEFNTFVKSLNDVEICPEDAPCGQCLEAIYQANTNLAELLEAENGFTEI